MKEQNPSLLITENQIKTNSKGSNKKQQQQKMYAVIRHTHVTNWLRRNMVTNETRENRRTREKGRNSI